MSWAERLEKIISEKGPRRQCQKCQKPRKHPFGTFGTTEQGVISKNKSEAAKRHAYHFRLHNSEGGGVYLTDEADLDSARNSLLDRYGDRLALVAKA